MRHGLNVTSVDLPSNLEAVGIQLCLPGGKRMFVVSVYWPPRSDVAMCDFVASLQAAVDDVPISSSCSPLCMVGD